VAAFTVLAICGSSVAGWTARSAWNPQAGATIASPDIAAADPSALLADPTPTPSQPSASSAPRVSAATTVASQVPETAIAEPPMADAKPAPAKINPIVAASPLGTIVTNGEPLPACAYSRVTTPLVSQTNWGLILVDTTYALPSGWVPAGLVPTTAAGGNSRELVRSIMIPDLRRMTAAATAAKAPLAILSAYRDYRTQVYTFGHWQNVEGFKAALISSARPGHSEHQLGLAIDFKSRGGPQPWTFKDWAKQTAAGMWLAANAWKYGFTMSYPPGRSSVTCYEYEPWHYRYVGVAEAAAIQVSGLTPRQWMWMHQPNPEPPSP
jgi:D-alanyl-D-alanine carboxypeptidase